MADIASIEDRLAIVETVTNVAALADRRDWRGLRDCFADDLMVDYASVRDSEPARAMKADDLIANWVKHFSAIARFHHHLGNIVPEIDGDEARCTASTIATHHRQAAGSSDWIYWRLGAYYDYRLRRIAGRWRIVSTKITKIWDRTDPAPALP